jgi:peroxin-2
MATSAPSTSRLATTISNTSTSLVSPGVTTDWTAATRAAQERVVALQAERAREANGIDRVKSFLNGDIDRPAFRVGQLDTELLDEELLELLKGQLWGGLKYFRVRVSPSIPGS